jgi:DNA-binding response OmpR family regulator
VTSAHIVVVDDEPDLRDMVREYLLKQGYAVSEAESGDALWTLLAERPVDLAILDINMPGRTGSASPVNCASGVPSGSSC